MKYKVGAIGAVSVESPPSRGAWIEIPLSLKYSAPQQSPPSRGAWIEIMFPSSMGIAMPSPPSRGAWIEISGSS